ncbi:MAG TPA: protein kinase [Chloroflexota bacterium]|jgi:serine/threonine-protein kinase|nr:protein kinase [Chloroflexota bacterium]
MTMPTRRIAGYELLEPIGHGGMAIVYKARQERLERTVAVKILSENLAASTEFMERFRREARTAANMRHPNVITVHDFGEDERGVPYLVLEYIEGPTLADLMDSGLDDDRIPGLLDQVAAGLDYAHARGVIHRDIKPGNVLITEDGRAVLADFGLAWLIEGAHLTLTGGVIGTPEYMSPEQAGGEPIDHRSDVYALGVVLYEMLVGERPFMAETPIGVLLKHLQDPAPSLLIARPDLSQAVADVISKVLVKDPVDRYSSAGELARAFRTALTGIEPPSPARNSRPSSGAFSLPPRPQAPSTSTSTSAAAPKPPSAIFVAPPAAGSASDALRPPSGDVAAEAQELPAMVCPECSATLPPGAGICPQCRYMIPLDQLPKVPARQKIQRREVVVNLLAENIRWTPDGLSLARRIAADALRDAAVDGWEPASIGEPFRLIEGRTIAGSVVEGVVLTLERLG